MEFSREQRKPGQSASVGAIDPRQFSSGYTKGRRASPNPVAIDEEMKRRYPGKHPAWGGLSVKRRNRVWTRSDGFRYKEFFTIEPTFFEGGGVGNRFLEWEGYAKISEECGEELWGRVCTRGRPVLVSGEVRSSGMTEWGMSGGKGMGLKSRSGLPTGCGTLRYGGVGRPRTRDAYE